MSMDKLPQAILSNILARVPGESLLQYRCVCKLWREAIDDSYFCNSLHSSKEGVILYHEDKKEEIYLLKIQEEAETRMIEKGKFPRPRGYIIQGTCNGLLLFKHSTDVKNNGELLINPLTKEILRLPRAPDLSPVGSMYGVGFDRTTNMYKMVQINAIDVDKETRTCTMVARIYDFNKRSWRTCKALPLSHSDGPCGGFVFASGALNWFLKNNFRGWLARAMLSFDLTKEEFSSIPIPDVFFKCGDFNLWTRMDELDGSLALVHSPDRIHTDVWVLRDYTRREWTRKYRIQPPCAAAAGRYYTFGPYMIGRYKGDKLILCYEHGYWYLYDVNKDEFTRWWIKVDALYTFCQCVTLSLASLGKIE